MQIRLEQMVLLGLGLYLGWVFLRPKLVVPLLQAGVDSEDLAKPMRKAQRHQTKGSNTENYSKLGGPLA